jgi:hypothetical protein
VADDPVVVTGRPDITEERCTLIVEKIESLIAIRDRSATQGVLMLSERDRLDQSLARLMKVLEKHRGSCPLRVKLEVSGAEVSMLLRDQKEAPICVLPSEVLCDEVEQLFGRPVLSFM